MQIFFKTRSQARDFVAKKENLKVVDNQSSTAVFPPRNRWGVQIRRQSGFTVIEMLIVIAMVLIFASIVWPLVERFFK